MQRAGALVDVMDAWPGALRNRGHEVSVALPFYREIRENRAFKKKDTGITVDIQVGDTDVLVDRLGGPCRSTRKSFSSTWMSVSNTRRSLSSTWISVSEKRRSMSIDTVVLVEDKDW